MKTSCEIIKDLLPLYHDGVCSNESKALVDEHLAECDNCKSELQTMNEIIPINNTAQNLSEAETLKGLSKKWKRGKLRSFSTGVIATIIALALIALFITFFSVNIHFG